MSITTNRTYDLHRLFRYPTTNGSISAVSVTAPDASMLLSVYSILVNSAVGQLWAIVIIMGVYATLRQPVETRSHNAVVASVGVLNAKKPLDVGTLTVKYLYTLGKSSPWSLTIWLIVSIVALVASIVVPALVGRSMILGHGAPASTQIIYVPAVGNLSQQFDIHILEVPSALRAAGSVQLSDLAQQKNNGQIEMQANSESDQELGEGEHVSRYHYRYQVSSLEFGLQNHGSLIYYVQGSCVTEYGWYIGTYNVTAETVYTVDEYHLWNDTRILRKSSSYGAPMPPMGYFVPQPTVPAQDDGSHRNTSFAIIISSSGRISSRQGRDPFYLTQQDSDGMLRVKPARPVLSCWQDDTWRYNGRNYSILELSSGDVSTTNFPHALGKIFKHFFLIPKIVTIGIRLGASALHSASAALGGNFDARNANVESDLKNLVLTSYVATKNTLADITLFEHDGIVNSYIPNLIEENELHDASDFVIYSREVSAISIVILITVPVIVVVMFIIAYLMTTHPWFPWHIVQDYQATILYSLLDEKMSCEGVRTADDSKENQRDEIHGWKRKSIAWVEGTPRASSRHASIISGDAGPASLTLKGHREFKRLDSKLDQRQASPSRYLRHAQGSRNHADHEQEQ